MPAFSRATASSVSPSRSAWSSPMWVTSARSGRSTFVASSRPPRPTSTTARSTSLLGEVEEAERDGGFEEARLDRRRTRARSRATASASQSCGAGTPFERASARRGRAGAARCGARRGARPPSRSTRPTTPSNPCRSCRRRGRCGIARADRPSASSSAWIRVQPRLERGAALLGEAREIEQQRLGLGPRHRATSIRRRSPPRCVSRRRIAWSGMSASTRSGHSTRQTPSPKNRSRSPSSKNSSVRSIR